MIVGCSANSTADVKEDTFKLQDLYSYSYNSVEAEHAETVNEWLDDARQSEVKMHIYEIKNDRDPFGYKYVFAKGYKEFEVSFVYPSGASESKGSIHIVGIEGDVDGETFIQIKFDPRYIQGTINSDVSIFGSELSS